MARVQNITIGFCDQYVTINPYGPDALNLINFLCCDLHSNTDAIPRAVYDLIIDDKKRLYSLRKEDEQLYDGDNAYDLAYKLINEIIYECLVDNRAGQAIHAAAIGSVHGGVLLAGKSGSGKSTLSTWLISHGCNYLTDELVVLAGMPPQILPFTRPLSLKTGACSVLGSLLDFDHRERIVGNSGMMLPHRMINTNFTSSTPPLSLVLFPQYISGTSIELTQLTGALGCARLMECYVNARNIQGHGISLLAQIARCTPIYQITYGSFDGLYELLNKHFPTLF
ncbi:MAG: hypothetical protein ACN4GW_16155 [Desulforhopalus sp.]